MVRALASQFVVVEFHILIELLLALCSCKICHDPLILLREDYELCLLRVDVLRAFREYPVLGHSRPS